MELDLHGSNEHTSLVSSIYTKMANESEISRICRVPETFYKENEDKYFPELVSIGPFHRGVEKLRAMEERKLQYLNTLLSRSLNVEIRLAKCVEALKALEERARKSYGEQVRMNSDNFVEMMLLDGCFIIELFCKVCCKGIRRNGDPFFATYQVVSRLRHDLVLLENQIPFFILQHLFHLVPIPKHCRNYSLTELAFRFFKKTIPEDLHELRENYGQEIHHLLDLIHQSLIPKLHIFDLQPKQHPQSQLNIPTITRLCKTGTEIKRAGSRSILEVKFNNGVLRIPALKHHELMETAFRNLVVMEHCCYDGAKYVTSYAFLMKSFVQLDGDGEILRKKGILDKVEEFVGLFREISVEVDVKDFCFGELCENLDNFAKADKTVWYRRKVRNCVTRFLREL